MNTTANLKRHPKTGVYRYRRTIPPRLVGLVGQVEGFEFKPDRKYFERSLSVREKAAANRLAAEIDKHVSEALALAERAWNVGARTAAPNGPVEPVPATSSPIRVDIAAALRALESWRDGRAQASEERYINLGEKPDKSAADFMLATFGSRRAVWDGREAIQAIPDFDDQLVAALRSQGIEIVVGHPALRLLRSEFHRQWLKAVEHEEHLRHDRLIFEPVAAPEASSQQIPSVAPGSAVPVLSEKRTRFLIKLDEWSDALPLKPRQKSMYISDVTTFAAHVADQSIETLTVDHAQSWVDSEQKRVSSKTITRKLSAIKSYWTYLIRAKIASKDHQPLLGLELPKPPQNKLKRKDFSRKQIVDFWRKAQANHDQPLADLIRLAAFTGARIESLCQITANTILTDDDTGIRYFHFNDKSDAGDRFVPIHDAISGMVDRLMRESVDGYLIRSGAANRHGERSPPLSKRFSTMKSAAGLGREYVFHSIRKTVCTLFQNMECPESVAADIVGHEVGTMTYGVYAAGSSMQTKKRWIDRLDYHSAEFAK